MFRSYFVVTSNPTEFIMTEVSMRGLSNPFLFTVEGARGGEFVSTIL